MTTVMTMGNQPMINFLLGFLPEGDPRPEIRLVARLHDGGQPLLGVCWGDVISLALDEIREAAEAEGADPEDVLLQVFFHEYHHYLAHRLAESLHREPDLSEEETELQAESWAALMMDSIGRGDRIIERPDHGYLDRGQIKMRWKREQS
jgi:hypothetical protein